MTPGLFTKRLIILPYLAGYVTDEHVAWLNDKHAMRYSEQRHRQHTLESQHIYINLIPPGSHIWLLRLEGDAGDVGTITVYRDRPNGVADMGILIAPNRQGNGYGFEAWSAVMNWLFTDGVRKVEAGMMTANKPMRALAVKSGMQFEGMKFRHFMFEGHPEDCLYYGRLK